MDDYGFENLASHKIVDYLYDNRKDFIILGLCGRVGSGVSTVSKILEKSFDELKLPVPGYDNPDLLSAYEYRVLYAYAEKNWIPFLKIRTSALITRHILCESVEEDEPLKKFVDFLLEISGDESPNERFAKVAREFYEKGMSFTYDELRAAIGDEPLKKFVTSQITVQFLMVKKDINLTY